MWLPVLHWSALPSISDAALPTAPRRLVWPGQLLRLLRAELLTDAVGHQKIAGQPFRVAELVDVIENLLPSGGDAPRPTAVA